MGTAVPISPDDALALALLGIPSDNEATLELWLLLGPH